MAKPNYQYEKRQKDLAKQRKKQEKEQEKALRKAGKVGPDGETTTVTEGQPGLEGEVSAEVPAPEVAQGVPSSA